MSEISVKKIIERIEKDVEDKIESIKQEKRKKAEKIRKEIEQEKERRCDELKKEKEREINTMKNRIISQAELESRKKRLTVREEMIERVFDKAKERLREMDPSDYKDYLQSSLEKITKLLEGDITIHCNSDERDMIDQVIGDIEHSFGSVEITDDLDTIGGIKANSDKGTSIDMTFEANLERKKKELRKEVSEILFLEEE